MPSQIGAAIVGSVSVSGGGGVQYVVGVTGVSTGTGTMFLGVNTDTARPVKVASDGTLFITGTISGGGGGIQYVQDTTSQANTASGTLFIGIQATTARALRLSITGDPGVTQVGAWTVTGTNFTVASITTGTVNVVNVLSASGITVASITAGTVSLSGLPIAIFETHIGTCWNSGLVTITTSAAGMSGILKTSAANTPYVTDIFISVDVPMNISLRSATTNMAILYFATKGGMAYQFKTPMICTTAQSFTFIPSSTGSASVWAAGYTVT